MTGIKIRVVTAILLGAVISFSNGAPALAAKEGDSDFFNFVSLEFPGTRQDRVLSDVNGDGLKDLVMVFSRSDVMDTYWLRTCIQEKAGGFSSDCQSMRLPEETRAFDVGEINGQKGKELVLITPRGLEISLYKEGGFGEFKRFPEIRTILADTDEGKPSLLRFIWDLRRDGKSELIIPTEKGPAIYTFNGESFELVQMINSPPHITYKVGSLGDIMATDDVNQFLLYRKYEKRTAATITAPDVFITDFDGDGRDDVVTLINNTLRVFPQGEEGKFPDKPWIEEKRSILPPEERDVGFAGEAMTFEHLDGDGMGDIIMMKWGTSEKRTQLDRYIYYGRKGGKFPERPDQIVRSESAAVDFGMYDLDNDNDTDLVVPFFHFAPAQAFKIMTENSIKVQFRIFLMRDDGRYSQDPGKTFAKVDRRVLLDYRIDVLGIIFDFRTLLEGRFHPLISFGYDVNGDGFKDIIADTGSDKLEFYWGNKDVNYSRTADHIVDYESAMDYDLDDINGDGKTDIITYYESEERTKKKRELAKKSRAQGEPVSDIEEEAELITAPEGTRVKALISK